MKNRVKNNLTDLFKKSTVATVDIQKQFYSMKREEGCDTAEITMYGEIVEEQPVDWWTGKPIEGSFIAKDEFIEDLESLGKNKKLTIHMDSVGGDATVSIFIHNKLREMSQNGTEITCIVDGVAMSGGSLIMCACDKVRVNPSSLIMIHKCWNFMEGCYNAEQLKQVVESLTAFDEAQAEIYSRKTGLGKKAILNMMSSTTYMTGTEAVEKGFADELTEDTGLKISASASGTSFYVKGREIRINDAFAPDFIPTAEPLNNKKEPINSELIENKKGVEKMTIDELYAKYPDLIKEIESKAMGVVDLAEATETSVKEAVQKERDRIRQIDEISSLYDNDKVFSAKYENPCTAQELAYTAAMEASKKGKQILADLVEDFNTSGNAKVATTTPPTENVELGEKTQADKLKEAKIMVSKLFEKKGE